MKIFEIAAAHSGWTCKAVSRPRFQGSNSIVNSTKAKTTSYRNSQTQKLKEWMLQSESRGYVVNLFSDIEINTVLTILTF
jgi:hypothetical protein